MTLEALRLANRAAMQVMTGTVLPRPDVEAMTNGLPAMLDRAVATLALAKSAAEEIDGGRS